jgi:predicted transcriptional regulator
MAEPEIGELAAKILFYTHKAGPAYVKKLAEILQTDQPTARDEVRGLVKAGLLERVGAAEVSYPAGKRGKVTKSRNHTYFQPTRAGKRLLRELEEPPDVTLTPVYKRSTK